MTGALLDGVRVVDLTHGGAAYAGRMLADLGADVILVEPPGGCGERHTAPLIPRDRGGLLGTRFAHGAAGKRSITVDLEVPLGQEVVRRLVCSSDVLLTTAGVGEMEARGLGYAGALRDLHRGLVYVSVTPFGLTGPRRRWRGSDLTAWASSGALPSIGDPDRAPLAPRGELATMAGALNAVTGAVAALTVHDRSGVGQLVDISLQEAVMSVALEVGPMIVLEGGFDQQRTGRRKPGGPIGHYPTVDGAVNIVAYMPEHWARLAEWVREVTGVEEITAEVFAESSTARAPYSELVDAWVEGLTMRYTKQAFFEEAQRRGITVGPVNTASDVLDDAHLAATGGWVQAGCPKSRLDVRFPAPPVRVDGATGVIGPVAAPGEHTRSVLHDDLGLDDDELRRLDAEGVTSP